MPLDPSADGSRPNILVIDDELKIRGVVRDAIAQDAGRCLMAGSGRDGLEIAAAERPDLIVLDLGLPDMDGIVVRVQEEIVLRETRKQATASRTVDRIVIAKSSRPPQTATLLRKASRIAGRLGSDWYCAYVQTSDERADRIDTAIQKRLVDGMRVPIHT